MSEQGIIDMQLMRVALGALPGCTRCMQPSDEDCWIIGVRLGLLQHLVGEEVSMLCCGKRMRRICTFETDSLATDRARKVSLALANGDFTGFVLIEVDMSEVAFAG